MTLNSWLKFIENSTSQNSADFSSVLSLAKSLDLTQFPCPVVTVAGTNGKGSCIAIMENILHLSNHRVAAITSPHFLRFNERLRIKKEEVADESFCQAFEVLRYYIKHITYYEFITLASLWILKQQAHLLDVILLEVGLGGRLDAANVVENSIAVITSIGLDHVDLLGDTRAKIAKEKAGIMRPKHPVVCGEPDPPKNLKLMAAEIGAKWYGLGQEFDYSVEAQNWNWWSDKQRNLGMPLPNLPVQNAATALKALALLPFNVKQSIVPGLKTVRLPGRFEEVGNIIFDVAHNEDSVKLLAKRLADRPCEGRTIAVFGALTDKNVSAMIAAIHREIDAWYLGELPTNRSLEPNALLQKLQDLGNNQCYNAGSITQAFSNARQASSSKERIIVFGSFYTAATIFKIIQGESIGS